ncbi:unnamed protein product [Hyaloperonospora brassicae]|uniref:Uncharacterized protein n=1 Tax=Hyaloperonospora brassicae TaxID=162125 RepID=A0AAV0U040_HYABA|nr:unnamed protein product [Hyaloperonospora brassicae]
MSFVLMEEINDYQSFKQNALAMIDDDCHSASTVSDFCDEICVSSLFVDLNRGCCDQNHTQNRRCHQRQNEEHQQSQMQMQRLQRHFSNMGNVDGSSAISEAKGGAREPSSVTIKMLQPQKKVEPLKPSLTKMLAMENRWSATSMQSTVETMSPANSRLLECTQSTYSRSMSSNPTSLLDDPEVLRSEIMALMDEMYDEAKATVGRVTGAKGLAPTLTCKCDKRLDLNEGPTTHITSETPLECNLNTARDFLAAIFSLPKPSVSNRMTQTKEKDAEQEVHSESGADYCEAETKNCLDGAGLLRRYTEDDCELIVWAAISFHDSGKILFKERSWAVATRPAFPTSHQESVVCINHCLSSSKERRCLYIDGEHIDQVRNHAVGAKSAQVKATYRMLQQKMLIETGRGDLANFIM